MEEYLKEITKKDNVIEVINEYQDEEDIKNIEKTIKELLGVK